MRPLAPQTAFFSLRVTLAATLFAGFATGCGEVRDPADLEAWYNSVQTVQLREAVIPGLDAFASDKRMRAAGFVRRTDRWERQADLTLSPPAVALGTGAMRHVRAVSVLSVDRRNGSEPYIYATLRSLLAELPDDGVVNVFVGNADVDYVSAERLQQKVFAGGEIAGTPARVHVVAADAADVDYMNQAHFSLSERASWNYARMLRGYAGDGYHVTFEDDVLLGRGSLWILDELLERSRPHVLSLYNHRCDRVPGFDRARRGTAQLATERHDIAGGGFWGTQSVAFRGDQGVAAGRYLQAYLGDKPFDKLLDRYLSERQRVFGYAVPSMVQHMGVQTTGLGFHHQSRCFADTYPAPDAD